MKAHTDMKRHIYYIITILAALLVAQSALGATWGKQASGSYTLDGNVTLDKTIVIANGTTLTLTATKNCSITASGITARMFDVQPGGKLEIIGDSGKVVTLNGGATVSLNGNDIKSATFSGTQMEEAIRTGGTLTLKYVTITNVYGKGSGGGVIVTSSDATILCGTTTIENCIIQKCYSEQGSALQLTTQNANKNKDSSKFPVIVTNTTIKHCYSEGDGNGGSGGTIRTNGGGVSDLLLTKVTVQYNYTGGSGGGIYWNAAGSNTTKCVFNQCTFSNNEALGQGGAMMLESTFSFDPVGGKTTISNNKATTYGGGIVITSYGGGAFTVQPNDKYTLTYTFSDKVEISNNTSSEGAGISFNFNTYGLNSDFSSADKNNANTTVTTNININGATISNNSATNGNGGGIRIYNNTHNWEGNKRTLVYNINVNSGKISNNSATGNGGGIYTYMANLAYDSVYAGNLTLSENTANGEAGGGIYLDGGTTIKLPSTSILNNSASQGGAIAISTEGGSNLSVILGNSTISGNHVTGLGGAIYLPKGNLTIANPTISSNYAATGGAIYIGGGSLTTTGMATIKDNYSTADGGAFYVAGGKVQLASATISGNGKNGSTVTTTNGGAIYVTGSGAGLSATGTVNVSGNAANTNGGALYVNGGSITLAENTFANNNAKVGGAVYQEGGSLTASGNSTIQNNYSTAEGGAFYVTGGKVQLASATISGNGKNGSIVTTTDGGAIYVTGSGAGLSATGTVIVSGNAVKTNGGALYVNGGSITLATNSFSGNTAANGGAVYLTTGNIKAGASTIENNYSTGNGGAFYVNGGNVEVTRALISGNGKNGSTATTDNGGAIYVEGSNAGFKATSDASILSNAAEQKGGALYVKGGSITLVKNTISSNSAATGGAIYTEDGGFSAVGTTEMTGNSASENGGAIYVDGGSINITGGSSLLVLTGNSAANGGVFYVNGGNITADQILKATITNNYSTAEGGAFYVTGGNINLCDTELSGNGKNGAEVKTTNGGAIALYNGVFSFGNNSEIKNNAAKNNGGALYVANNNNTSISCSGGSYINNTASLGGGIYASGPIILAFAANVRDNIAKNGGGLFLDGGVNMSFGNGLIVGNRAEAEQNVARDASQYGVGGGIYLNKGTLSFTATQNLGIYNNAASYEAADIYASGASTTINLPNVKGMNLTGFDVPGSELYWVEDYNEQRYEAALRDLNVDIEDLILEFAADEPVKNITEEICLDLGYDLVFVTLKSIGLGNYDAAALKISYNKNGIETEYRKVVFMGSDTQVVGLPSGKWSFDVTPWAKKYESVPVISTDPDSEGYIEITRQQNQDISFTFKKLPGAANVVTYDYKKVNKMKPGGSSTH